MGISRSHMLVEIVVNNHSVRQLDHSLAIKGEEYFLDEDIEKDYLIFLIANPHQEVTLLVKGDIIYGYRDNQRDHLVISKKASPTSYGWTLSSV